MFKEFYLVVSIVCLPRTNCNMKKHLLFFFMLFLGFSINAKTASKNEKVIFEEIILKDNLIKVSGKFKGTFEVKTKDINVNSKSKNTVYEVSIFDPEGVVVANLNLQVTDKTKKKSFKVIDATLKTMRDKVNHYSSNFIDFEDPSNSIGSEVPQFDNVIKYLISYNYL